MVLSLSLRRPLLAVAGSLLAVLGFELVLQAIALGIWWSVSEPGTGDGDVLCVGDSFTYGLGADRPEESYPLVAEQLCRERGRALGFVNWGWAGQTSRDVLLRLPGQLRRVRPRLVYVLVGTNDFTVLPDEVRPDELRDEAAGFAWCCRTLRLARLIEAWLSGAAAPGAPFLGIWHDDEHVVWFGADGHCQFDGLTFDWQLVAGELQIIAADGWRQPLECDVGDRLRLYAPSWPMTVTLDPGPPLSTPTTSHEGPRRLATATTTPREEALVRAAVVLQRHLERILELCRAAGARPVFLNYPGRTFAKPGAQQALRAVARRTGIDFIDVADHFDTVGATAVDAFWVADGHCSSPGYAIMAELVAQHALAALSPSKDATHR